MWTETVVEAVARRRAIVVLGAGSSFHSTPLPGSSHPPDWKTFLTNAAEKLPAPAKREARSLIKVGEYLSSCEIIKSGLGAEWAKCVDSAFGHQKLEPGELHTHVYELDLPIVMTTNFDKVYQSAATKLSSSTVKIKSYLDKDLALVAKGDVHSRILLKAHGSIDDIGSMIFTRSDYIRLRNEHPLFQRVVSSLSITNTLIFVGCGLRDPDLILMLEDLAAVSKGYGEHVCVIDSRQSSELERVYRDCFGLKCFRYKYDRPHTELPKMIATLADLAAKKRLEMATASLW
jgi:hypothetical protein